jgi:hypothetical protein
MNLGIKFLTHEFWIHSNHSNWYTKLYQKNINFTTTGHHGRPCLPVDTTFVTLVFLSLPIYRKEKLNTVFFYSLEARGGMALQHSHLRFNAMSWEGVLFSWLKGKNTADNALVLSECGCYIWKCTNGLAFPLWGKDPGKHRDNSFHTSELVPAKPELDNYVRKVNLLFA